MKNLQLAVLGSAFYDDRWPFLQTILIPIQDFDTISKKNLRISNLILLLIIH